MLKKSVNIVLLASLLGGGSLFAKEKTMNEDIKPAKEVNVGNNNKVEGDSLVPSREIIVIKNTSMEGKKILHSLDEYKEFMNNKMKAKVLQEERFSKNGAGCSIGRDNNCEINKIKVILAKLIGEVHTLKIEVSAINKRGLSGTSNGTNATGGENSSLVVAPIPVSSGVSQSQYDEDMKKLNDRISDLEAQIERLYITESENLDRYIQNKKTKSETKEVCKDVYTRKKFQVSKINESYIDFSDIKTFKIGRNYVKNFKLPYLESKTSSINGKKFYPTGTKVKADMYTKAGWVHIVGEGWVKGYKLSPKVSQIKDKKAYTKKTKCKTITVTK